MQYLQEKPEEVNHATSNLSPDKAEAIEAFEEIKRNNPEWRKLAEDLNLEPIQVTHLKPTRQ